MAIGPIQGAQLGLQRAQQLAFGERPVRAASPETPQPDLVRKSVDQKVGATLYRANLAVIKVADDMTGELLDTFA